MSKNTHLPLYVDMKDKEVLVFGGGKIAKRRIGIVYDFEANVTVVAPFVLPEIKELNVLKKMAKEFKDEIENSKKAGNQGHANEVESQLKILEEFIPAPVSEEDIESSVKEIIKTIDHPLSMKDMGVIISQVRSKFPTADGGIISKVVKSQING